MHKVMLYALSTCVWCKRTRQFLDECGVEYQFVYVDDLDLDERVKLMEEVRRWNPRGSFPTIVVDDTVAVVGFNQAELREALGL
ncbi:MAG: glutaredoxin family protein [Anaerolineae bacterium]